MKAQSAKATQEETNDFMKKSFCIDFDKCQKLSLDNADSNATD
jgi:hypothetical protein